jgi:hypothetical protein
VRKIISITIKKKHLFTSHYQAQYWPTETPLVTSILKEDDLKKCPQYLYNNKNSTFSLKQVQYLSQIKYYNCKTFHNIVHVIW